MSLNVIFLGTPDFAVPLLTALHDEGHNIMACYTQPPRPAGRRGLGKLPSPVHQAADELKIPVHHPSNLKSAEINSDFINLEADVAVVVAYGQLLPAGILAAPRFGCLNAHASLLPRWRGAAPINRAIMAGDGETGVAIMKMTEGLDTGPIAMMEKVVINQHMTAGELHDALATLSANLMVKALSALEQGKLTFSAQEETGVTYAKKLEKSETRINWSSSANVVCDHIRGLSPFPGAWCLMPVGDEKVRVKILSSDVVDGRGQPGIVLDDELLIGCGSGAVRLRLLQRAGKSQMSAEEFLRGNTIAAGLLLE